MAFDLDLVCRDGFKPINYFFLTVIKGSRRDQLVEDIPKIFGEGVVGY